VYLTIKEALMLRVFVSHPLTDNVEIRRAQNRELIATLKKRCPGVLFVSPLLLFDCEENDDARDDIMAMCKALISACDETWVFGRSEGCAEEAALAEKIGKNVKRFYGQNG
jgi:hypothetical protein